MYPFSVYEECLDYMCYVAVVEQNIKYQRPKKVLWKIKWKFISHVQNFGLFFYLSYTHSLLNSFTLQRDTVIGWCIPSFYIIIYMYRFHFIFFGTEQLYMVMKCVTLQTSCSEREMCLHWMSGSGIWINVFRLDADWSRWFIVYNLRIYVFLVWQKMFEMATDEFM